MCLLTCPQRAGWLPRSHRYVALVDVQDVFDKMSLEQQQDYTVSSVLLSAILGASVLGAVAVAAALVFIQVSIDGRNLANLRRLKYFKDSKWVECKKLTDPQAFHLFRASPSLDSSTASLLHFTFFLP